MKSLTIEKRITFGFVATLLVVLGLGSFAYARLVEIRRHATTITTDCLPGLAAVSDILRLAQGNYVLTLRSVLAENEGERKGYLANIQTNVLMINQLTNEYRRTMTVGAGKDLFTEMIVARAHYVTTFKEVVALGEAGKSEEARAVIRTKLQPTYDHFEKAIANVMDFNKTYGHESGEAIGRATASSVKGMTVGIGAAFIVGIVIAFWITRSVNKVLRRTSEALSEGAEQVAAASRQVAAASQSLAEGAGEQAASLEETSASLEEMTSMVKRNAESARQAKTLAGEATVAVDTGATDMHELQSAMSDIQASGDDIAKVVKSIDEIAFQTNILALNAAVEAARAGEAGAGFAVVADEVRNLAQRSAAAARETASMIATAVAKSHRGVTVSGKVSTGLGKIVQSIRNVDQLVGEIAAATAEQAQGIAQVNTAVSEMDKVTQSNASGAEESASAAEELSTQAEAMRESVTVLQTLINGHAKLTRTETSPCEEPTLSPTEKPSVSKQTQPVSPKWPVPETNRMSSPVAAETIRLKKNEPETMAVDSDEFRSF